MAKWGVTANGYGVFLGVMKNVLKLIVVIVAQLCEYTKNYCLLPMGTMYGMHVNYTLIKMLFTVCPNIFICSLPQPSYCTNVSQLPALN